MTAKKIRPPIPRVTLTPEEAAASLGCGIHYFDEHVRPDLRLIRRGRKVLVPVAELERWVTENTEAPMREQVGR
jgi:hypothetical protein